jgi:hypothetical protein
MGSNIHVPWSLAVGSMHKIAFQIGCAAVLAGCATTSSPPPATWDGLEYRPGKESGALYARPGAESRAYHTVMLDPLAVAIPDNWYPVGGTNLPQGASGPRKLSSDEIQHIKAVLADRFRTLFTNELADGGYPLVERPNEDTVRVSPGLANIFMDTPEHSLAAGLGADTMTLVMDLRDATTGQLLVRLVDEQSGTMGALQFPNTVVNSADFRHAVKAWAQRLKTGLDQMGGHSP